MIKRAIHKLTLMSSIFVLALACRGECAELIHSVRVNSEKVDDFCFTGIAKFSPDGRYIASGGTGPILSIIDAKTGKVIKNITVGGKFTITTDEETGRLTSAVEKYTAPLGALAFTSDSKYVAVGGSSRYIHLYDIETGELVKTYDISQRTAESIVISNDDKSIIASSLYSLCIFSADNQNKLIQIDSPVLDPVVISSKGNLFASGATIYKEKEDSTISEVEKRVVYLWEYPSLKLIREIDGNGCLLAFSPDEKYLAYAAGDFPNDIQIWDLQNNKPFSLFQDKTNNENAKTSIIFTPDGKYLLCAEGKNIKIIDLAENKIKDSWLAHKEDVTSLDISSDGEYLSSTGEDGFLKVWRLTR